MPPFRDDQVMIIAPGSETTLAQLGLPESFTPARFRFRSRMFPAETEGEYEPVKIRRKQKAPKPAPAAPTNGESTNADQRKADEDDDGEEWEADRISEEGAVWPIRGGRIVDWRAFYALMTHVHNTVNPPFHTPILLVAQPVWTAKEHEKVTQFFFEKFKTPAFSLVDSAMAASYAYGVPTATVVDIGLHKSDITCIADFVLHDVGRSLAVPDCGGEAMTQRLEELLKGRKGFTRDMCEQLKKSNICEILPADWQFPSETTGPDAAANPAAAASTGMDGVAPGQRKPSVIDLPRGPGPGTQVDQEKQLEDDEGVLDVASIVTSGNMTEYLAQKEREKAEKAAAKQQKKGNDAQAQLLAKPVRLPNSKRRRNVFTYEDFALHDAMKKAGASNQGMADMHTALNDGPNKRQTSPEPQSAVSDRPGEAHMAPTGGFRREIEVGIERFEAASGGILDRLADAIYRTIQSCGDIHKRSELWDSLIFVGNGSKVRGFKEALLARLQSKYIISPSSATIFTSELPSNLSTPMATGTNTPQPQLPGQMQHHGPNPLLVAATTAQNPQFHHTPSLMGQPHPHSMHFSHAQTPTNIREAKVPEYFPEWKEVGFDEATFLGAQVAAKVLFVVDGGVSKGYMTRTDYNDQGPMGIHEVYVTDRRPSPQRRFALVHKLDTIVFEGKEKMALQKTVFSGPFIHSESLDKLEICPNGSIGVDESGKIAFVLKDASKEEQPSGWEQAKAVKIQGHGFFFPGFIDTHIHAPQYPNSGIFGKSTLLDWLETYTFPLESSFSDLAQAKRVYNRVVSRTLSHGTTTACYYATIHVPATNLLADICHTKGQRAFVGRVCMDRMSPDYLRDENTEQVMKATHETIDHIKKIDPAFDLITPILTPRFAPSCTNDTLTELGKLHKASGLPCQTHISENKDEIKLVHKLFPDNKSYADVYDSFGLLTEKTILAHAIHLSAEERALVKMRQAKISHCPASNTAITSGEAPVRLLLDEGLTVGLGTDVSGGYTSSMLAEAREAIFVSRHIAMREGDKVKLSVEEALYLATRGGAKVVGLEDRIGGFEVGMDWDAMMVNLASPPHEDDYNELDQSQGVVDVFGKETWDEKVAKWVYTGDDRNTSAVWVKGRLVHCRKGVTV
ncbi:Hypothetical protein R9X50_00227400 [Acrodontium crateriforme]|uniref:Guanine deaminase n=1 Tax=Acrodontium crateriforme TaxID=150365 RepID=A0AAQ3R8F5_9PEZI|nr:Hypothetical protein R9X50_00227400 [Acrodontium crateriforme]